MKKTPHLFDVPKTHPTAKQRLDSFKEKHQIATHSAKMPGKELDKWLACHMPSARDIGANYGVASDADLFTCFAKVGRLLDESGVTQYGKTEREAVLLVCGAIGIPTNDLR